jgi:uncharacterized membrane protein
LNGHGELPTDATDSRCQTVLASFRIGRVVLLGERAGELSELPRINIRIESLSDLVFGLALSIGSLELLSKTPQNPKALATSVGLFAFSFLIVVAIWLGYSRIMAVMPKETSGALSLNLFLLFGVVLEPYLFFVLQSTSSDFSLLNWTSFGYALDVGSMFLILAALIMLIIKGIDRKELKLHPLLLDRFRLAMYLYIFVGGAYLLSAVPFFWIDTPVGPLRFVFWYSSFAFVFLGIFSRRRERLHKPKKSLPPRS